MFTKMMIALNAYMTSLQNNEEGQGLVEYALVLVLVAVVAIGALTLVGGEVNTVFGDILAGLQGGA